MEKAGQHVIGLPFSCFQADLSLNIQAPAYNIAKSGMSVRASRLPGLLQSPHGSGVLISTPHTIRPRQRSFKWAADCAAVQRGIKV